ncbi:hypothetical protein FOL47_006017, partial [Perkinsus chesapeaki]
GALKKALKGERPWPRPVWLLPLRIEDHKLLCLMERLRKIKSPDYMQEKLGRLMKKDAPSIKVGDMVLVRRFTNTRLGYRWSKPLKVKEVTMNGSLYLQDDADPTARLVGPVNIVHVLSVDNVKFRMETIDTT